MMEKDVSLNPDVLKIAASLAINGLRVAYKGGRFRHRTDVPPQVLR